MSEYKEGDFLRIVPEFDNPYDHNALAIYDDFNHKLGFIDKYTNVEIYRKIKDINYICYITNVHTDYSRPSIEFAIAYETDDSNEDIPGKLFYFYLSKYGQRNLSKAKGDNSNGYDGKQIARKNIGFYTSVTLNRHKAIMLAQSYIDNDDFDSAIDILMDFKNDNDAEVDTRLASAYFLRNDDAEDMKMLSFILKNRLMKAEMM